MMLNDRCRTVIKGALAPPPPPGGDPALQAVPAAAAVKAAKPLRRRIAIALAALCLCVALVFLWVSRPAKDNEPSVFPGGGSMVAESRTAVPVILVVVGGEESVSEVVFQQVLAILREAGRITKSASDFPLLRQLVRSGQDPLSCGLA